MLVDRDDGTSVTVEVWTDEEGNGPGYLGNLPKPALPPGKYATPETFESVVDDVLEKCKRKPKKRRPQKEGYGFNMMKQGSEGGFGVASGGGWNKGEAVMAPKKDKVNEMVDGLLSGKSLKEAEDEFGELDMDAAPDDMPAGGEGEPGDEGMMTSDEALDAIAAALSGKEWEAEVMDEIAEIIRGTGREIEDVEEEPEGELPGEEGDEFEEEGASAEY